MQKNFNVVIKTLDGTPFKEGENDVLLKTVCVNALYAPEYENGQQKRLSGEEHMERHKLAKKIHESTGAVEISAEEIAALKKLISVNYLSSVVGAAFDVLEG